MAIDYQQVIAQSLMTGFGSALGSFAASWFVIRHFEKIIGKAKTKSER